MALPLPNALSDLVGGAIPNVMNAHNTFANNAHERGINALKEQYAPYTIPAEAASKLAYANLVGPQFLAKILGNDAAVANLGSDASKDILQKITKAGSNPFSQPQGSGGLFSGIGQPSTNSFSGWLTGKLKNAFGMNQGVNPQLGNTLNGIAHVESGGAKDPYSLIGRDAGHGDHAIGKYQVMESNVPSWTKEALGQSMTPQEFLNSPQAQEKVAAYMVNKHLNKGNSPHDVGSIWLTGKPLSQAGNIRDINGTNAAEYVKRMDEAPNQPEKSYAQKAGEYKGTIRQLEKEGEIRANAREDLGKQYQQSVQAEVPLKHLNEIVTNPTFQNLRKIPGFQKLQLDSKQVIGSPEEQRLIGDFRATALNAVAQTVMGFGGRILQSEVNLANDMKINPNDSFNVMLGKLPAIESMQEMTKQRALIATKLMKNQHLDRADALEQADKMIDGKAIRKNIEDSLDYPVEITNKKTGEKRTIKVSEARKLGVPNV
ncbi:hypothetical protein UFOVP100_54 [uncultured Caudovirales phage]|uniref:Uncharacterized protein n=1 Tax=uncultured Caudovirales phage TaxID=2100421 RepID=A0A6J5L1F4_9CAUD|nr:hypothetical protein UFOVP100_54 [uncultured Caudovirales phage]